MKKLSEREVQLGELEILKKLDKICREQGLKYFLSFGTLIGAVRHQGFIPWDDDVDVMMPRLDYEKLLRYVAENQDAIAPLKLMNWRTDRKYIYPISRLCDTRYYVEYEGTVDYGLGLFVDIYPFDGCGDTPEEVRAIADENRLLTQLTFQAGMKKFQKSGQSGWRTPVKFLGYCYAKLMGPRHFIRKLEQNGQKRSYSQSKYVNCVIWDTVDYGYPRELFETTVYLPFEDASFAAPGGYDEALRICYGDYMQLPPEEDRVGHHYYTAYLKEE